MGPEKNECDHYFVWTWPIDGPGVSGYDAVAVCFNCRSVKTADRDRSVAARAIRDEAGRLFQAMHDHADEVEGYRDPTGTDEEQDHD